jgi:hypothetical protein
MNFQPIDYLNDLNLNFDILSPNIETNDLDLFSDSNFLNYELNEPVKSNVPSGVESSVVSPSESSVVPIKVEPMINEQVPTSDFVKIEANEHQDVAVTASLNDKRKRNTAASARFRIKKKLKEQQMDTELKRLTDKVVNLEKTLKQLNMENKCLKSLILQKNDEKNQQLLQSIKSRSIMDSSNTFQYTN